MIGSLDYLCPLWLARVITLVLVLRHSIGHSLDTLVVFVRVWSKFFKNTLLSSFSLDVWDVIKHVFSCLIHYIKIHARIPYCRNLETTALMLKLGLVNIGLRMSIGLLCCKIYSSGTIKRQLLRMEQYPMHCSHPPYFVYYKNHNCRRWYSWPRPSFTFDHKT